MIDPVTRPATLVVACLLTAASTAAQYAPDEVAELSPGVGKFNGLDVVLHDDVAFLGAPNGLTSGLPRAVRAYRKVAGEWELEQTIVHPDAGAIRFGWSLDFDGTTLVVGSPSLPSLAAPAVATAYTYDGSAWVGTDLPAPPQQAISYGSDVAVDGELILVGAPAFDVPTSTVPFENAGAAYAYRRNLAGEWKLKQELLPSFSTSFMLFGLSLDIAGTNALVGASGADRTFAFEWNQGTLWTQTQILQPSSATPDNAFGDDVALDGRRAVIGAPQDDTFANGGAAFVFHQNCRSWAEVQRIDPPAGAGTIGRRVAIDGDTVIVGAQGEASGELQSAGAAYAYRWNGAQWLFEQRLAASDPASFDSLGRSVAIDGDTALIGAIGASADQAGKALLFEAAPVSAPWTDLGFALGGSGGGGGDLPELDGLGTLAPSTPFDLVIGCGPESGTGVLVVGLDEIDAPFKGGTLVPAPTALVTGLLLDGSGGLTLSSTWPTGVPAGTTITTQTWFADASGPVGFISTNALRLTAQ